MNLFTFRISFYFFISLHYLKRKKGFELIFVLEIKLMARKIKIH